MKLIDCLKEGQPCIALLHKQSWLQNKCLLRYGNKLEIVTAWNAKEDFIPTVDDLFEDDWEIASAYDVWLRAGLRDYLKDKEKKKCKEKTDAEVSKV